MKSEDKGFTKLQLKDTCPNCHAPRAGVQDERMVFKCGTYYYKGRYKITNECNVMKQRLIQEWDIQKLHDKLA